MKKNNKKGFTLAELLIVVAIIAVLVAISIPIFNAQLKKAKLATNQANARAAYASAIAARLESGSTAAETYEYEVSTAKATGGAAATGATAVDGAPADWTVDNTNLGDDQAKTWYVTFSSGDVVTFSYK